MVFCLVFIFVLLPLAVGLLVIKLSGRKAREYIHAEEKIIAL